MKKILLIFVMVLMAFCISAQVVSEANGTDWVTWNYEFKKGYMYGYLSANDAVWEWMYHEFEAENDQDIADGLTSFFWYEGETVDTIIGRLNNYYARDPDNLKYTICDTIMFLCGKDYWNDTGGSVIASDDIQ
jgi:hypothetical protein